MFYAPAIGKKLRHKPATKTSEAILVNESPEKELYQFSKSLFTDKKAEITK